MNRRSLWLRLRWQLWWIPAMTAMGALLAAILYMGIWLNVSGQRQYRQNSKYYLTFGNDAAGNPQDYYNDYTWNDLLFSVPAISQVIEVELPDGMTMTEAREDIEAQILSDVRVLTIQVTDADPEIVQSLTNAVEDALVRYGSNAEEFQKIEFLSSDDVQQVVVTDRSQSAVILGGILGFLFSVCAIWFRELMDDGVYCPEDAARRYGLPVLMTLGRKSIPAFLEAENQAKAQHLQERQLRLVLVCEDDSLAEDTARQLQDGYSVSCCTIRAEKALADYQEMTGSVLAKKPSVPAEEIIKEAEVTAAPADETSEIAPAKVSAASGDNAANDECHNLLAIVVPYGCRNGARTEHLLEQMKARRITPAGLILAEADGAFLQKYYKTF